MFKTKEDAKSVFECCMGEVVHNNKGKITQKTEIWPQERNIFKYGYDAKGHLTSVHKNGKLVESYAYNELGQRVSDFEGNEYKYTDEGRLYEAGGLKMYYDEDGQLVDRKQNVRTAQLEKKMRKSPESVPPIRWWGRIKFSFEPSSSVAGRKANEPVKQRTLLTASSSKPTKWLKVNQRLVGAVLPDMSRVRYEYDLKPTESPAVADRGVNETHKRNSLPFVSDVSNERIQDVMPARIYQDNCLAWECQWRKDLAPQKLVDTIRNITYTWIYRKETDPLPVRLCIEGDIIKELDLASGIWGENKERFLVGFDQVGSLRALINSNGNIVKRIDYDSFGNVLSDSLPKLFIPQGFAGGMTDPYTGLTKFGYRYYDPMVGRFITLDPAKDYRGDGDLYDYCVDDPIGRVDRDGRIWWHIPVALAGGAGIAGTGLWGAAETADAIESSRKGKDSDAAFDATWEAGKKAAGAVAGAKTGVAAHMVAPAASAAASAVSSRLVPYTVKHEDKIRKASEFVEGYASFPNATPPKTGWGFGGFGAGVGVHLWDNYKK